MQIHPLEKKTSFLPDILSTFQKLLTELRKRTIPQDIIEFVNQELEKVNSFTGPEKDLVKQVKTSQASILKLIEKEMKLVPKNHYRNMWLALGMASFGIPLGVIFGLSLGNMAFLGIGLPIGMGIGIAVGTALDKKAADSGNQLDLEISH
jgi:hypothetical protein